MKLLEITSVNKKGTYAGYRFCDKSVKKLIKLGKQCGVDNIIDSEDFHTTLLYSRKRLPEYKPKGILDEPLVAKLIKAEIWPTNSNMNALVIILESPKQVSRHKYLMKTHKGTWDYPNYIPHFTLSYDCGKFSKSELSKLNNQISDKDITINLINEYSEDLILNWEIEKDVKKK